GALGAAKRARLRVPRSHGDVGVAGPVRVDLALSHAILCRCCAHSYGARLRTLAGAPSQPQLDQHGFLPPQCAHQPDFPDDHRRFGGVSTVPHSMAQMNFALKNSELRDLYDKTVAGERFTDEEALRLFRTKDINALGALADIARQRKVGNRATYIVNAYIN